MEATLGWNMISEHIGGFQLITYFKPFTVIHIRVIEVLFSVNPAFTSLSLLDSAIFPSLVYKSWTPGKLNSIIYILKCAFVIICIKKGTYKCFDPLEVGKLETKNQFSFVISRFVYMLMLKKREMCSLPLCNLLC